MSAAGAGAQSGQRRVVIRGTRFDANLLVVAVTGRRPCVVIGRGAEQDGAAGGVQHDDGDQEEASRHEAEARGGVRPRRPA